MTTETLLGVRAGLLDCIQANLAVLADRHLGPDTHLALGADLRFQPAPGPFGLPTVEPGVTSQVGDAVRALGLTTRLQRSEVTVSELRELAAGHPVLYAVADAYHLSWLPYFRRRHMQHSFLVEDAVGGAGITDAYHNVTPWGTAEPGRWYVPWTELPTASLVTVLERDDERAPARPRLLLEDSGDYIAAYRGHPERAEALNRLTTETWLLARSRKLHGAFRAAASGGENEVVTGHLKRWDQIATQAFVTLRRVERGMAEPPGLLGDLRAALDADHDVFTVA